MTTLSEWLHGARPRTLGAAVAPVVLAAGATALHSAAHPGRTALAALVSVSLQVAVNYANDYSDGIRGTDADRQGPMRLVGSGAASARSVAIAAALAAVVAAIAGLFLVAFSGHWWLLAVGVICIIAAWFYTGGKRPYGYAGLGEVAVFVFFGPVAALGTQYTQINTVTWPAIFGSIGCGLLAVNLMLANNIRDIPGDTVAGKRTLAVRIGDRAARKLFVATVLAAGVSCVAAALASAHPWPLLGLVAVGTLVLACKDVLAGARGPELIDVLARTGQANLLYGLCLAVGFALTAANL